MKTLLGKTSPLRVSPLPPLYKITALALLSNALAYLLFVFLVALVAGFLPFLLLIPLVTGCVGLCAGVGIRFTPLIGSALVALTLLGTFLEPENFALLFHPDGSLLYAVLLLLFLTTLFSLVAGLMTTFKRARSHA